ncbi:DEAD/DEAH box helicase family protein [Rhizobium sp. WYCCWR 11279]|uniref:DEAD/DEAH box helicase family protein n=1 Tax=Rhizobium changzhiense TaxID=2692317 RepID=UPI0014927FC9|nr:DEAD/DEAH box helicase family protein [Rhizobium changzhiense]NNU48191.1 DEAD/DEAH box helicase family protein [Rhizobium changzhiense]
MKDLAFQGTWRTYQQKILDDLANLIGEDGLHIVAAPGSGKTILGLEVMRRLGEATLILAPSKTIRDQWAQRLRMMFLPANVAEPDWISHDLRAPGAVTIITYQALHAAFSGHTSDEETLDSEEEGSDGAQAGEPGKQETEKARKKIIAKLREEKVRTLVLDEAHHLRNEWWKALTMLKEALGKPTVVALTATPPYDVDPQEWDRYQALCGPIDGEISVPELVLQGDLCPHQDYVHFSLPSTLEAQKLAEFRAEVGDFIETLLKSAEFKQAILRHPWITQPIENVEHILDDARFLSSMLIFLNSQYVDLPQSTLDILDVKAREIPDLTLEWIEALLNGVIYTYRDDFGEAEQIIRYQQERLREIKAVDHGKVRLTDPRSVQKLLVSSVSKLDAIVDIARLESVSMRDELRMVILSDYIRKDTLPTSAADLPPLGRMGVVPIFETLRRSGLDLKLGILTGSMVLIPAGSKAILDEIADHLGIGAEHMRYQQAAFDAGFVSVELEGERSRNIVHMITELFGRGGITVLVGTQALLGEGWDAPSVNTLILASTVGSYVLSNQMRGRAIRIDPQKPQKTANVWHLAVIDPEKLEQRIPLRFGRKSTDRKAPDPFDTMTIDLGSDVDALKRRFYAFEGLSFGEPPLIESSFQRLMLGSARWNARGVDDINTMMERWAIDRQSLKARWHSALRSKRAVARMQETLESNYAPKGLVNWNTTKFLFAQSAAIAGMIVNGFLHGLRGAHIRSLQQLELVLFVVFALLAIFSLPGALKAGRLLLRNGSLEGSMKQVGTTVLEALHHIGVIKTELGKISVEATLDENGIIYCRLEGATTIERSRFLDALREVLVPPQNPRYIVVRRSTFWRLKRVDYHAVPSLIGRKREDAVYFAKLWNRYVGDSDLIYTRSVQGRLILLQFRAKSFASAFTRKTDRVSRWE